MATNSLSIDTSRVDEQRLQELLAKQAEIQAQIAAMMPGTSSTSFPHHRSPIYKTLQRRNSHAIPRSVSSNGVPSMARHLSIDRADFPVQRPRTLSQRSAPPMARLSSKGTSSQRTGNLPFTQNGAMPPPLNTESRRENPAMTAWATQEQPYSTYTYNQPQMQRSMSQRKFELQQVPEMDQVMLDPADFINQFTSSTIPSPAISIPSTATLTNHRLSVGSSNIPTPSTPSSETLTTATTLTGSMSRQDSLNEPILESMQMMKFDSRNSYSTDLHDPSLYHDHVNSFASSRHIRRCSIEEQSQLLVGAGGASHESQVFPSFQSSSSQFGEKMEKSQSNESTSSSSSKSSRNVQRLQDQINLAAKRALAPKGGSEQVTMSRENSSQSMARVESKDGSQDKVAISSKSTYQRPKHDRVYCKQCDNHQEGFRGEHELRRHQDREHKLMVKKWVCQDPSAIDGKDHPKPVIPLSRCKACNHQKKRYGAYYNAAAHLRRSHFKPKAKGRSKNNKVDDVEKRGGKGGGDWPPMNELKYWMKEVEEPAVPMTDAQQQAADAAEASDEDLLEMDDQAYSQPSVSSMSNSDFDMSFLEASPITNIYPTIASNDMYTLQNMPLNMNCSVQQSQCMDQSMYGATSQNSFPDLSSEQYFSNGALAFMNDPSVVPQFEDQILTGPNFVNFSSY